MRHSLIYILFFWLFILADLLDWTSFSHFPETRAMIELQLSDCRKVNKKFVKYVTILDSKFDGAFRLLFNSHDDIVDEFSIQLNIKTKYLLAHLISKSRISSVVNVVLFVTSNSCLMFSSRCFFFLEDSFPCSTLMKSHSFFNSTVSTE